MGLGPSASRRSSRVRGRGRIRVGVGVGVRVRVRVRAVREQAQLLTFNSLPLTSDLDRRSS